MTDKLDTDKMHVGIHYVLNNDCSDICITCTNCKQQQKCDLPRKSVLTQTSGCASLLRHVYLLPCGATVQERGFSTGPLSVHRVIDVPIRKDHKRLNEGRCEVATLHICQMSGPGIEFWPPR